MNDSTRRSLRTLYQGIVALLTIVPVLLSIVLPLLPPGTDLTVKVGAIAASVLAGLAVVTKVINALEDRGLIPAWLKGDTPIDATTPSAGAHVITDVPPAEPGVDQ